MRFSNLVFLQNSIQIDYIKAVSSNSVNAQQPIEAARIRHNELYSVHCVRIDCSSENITILGSDQVFDERILLRFFYTTHSISVLGKEAKS